MNPRHLYLIHGLTAESNEEIPEWAGFEAPRPEARADIRISIAADLTVELPGEYRFTIENVATFSVAGGESIAVKPHGKASRQTVRTFLLGSGLAALFHQRGDLILHASAVETPAGAVLFCGRKGAGKSTVAAALAAGGLPLIAEDLVRLERVSVDRFQVFRSATGAKLSRNSSLARGADNGASSAPNTKKFVPVENLSSAASFPLARIYILQWGKTGLERLRGVTAVRRFLAAAAVRPDLLERTGHPVVYAQQCVELLSRTELWEFARPPRPDWFQKSMDSLLASLTGKNKEESALPDDRMVQSIP